jgi:hypothetical protein
MMRLKKLVKHKIYIIFIDIKIMFALIYSIIHKKIALIFL